MEQDGVDCLKMKNKKGGTLKKTADQDEMSYDRLLKVPKYLI